MAVDLPRFPPLEQTIERFAYKQPVRVATTGVLPAHTDTALTRVADANGALPMIDGVALAVNDRLLDKDNVIAARRGPWVVTDLGSGGAPWRMIRATDANEDQEVRPELVVRVAEGTANAGSQWFISTDFTTYVPGTTALTFALAIPAGGAAPNDASYVVLGLDGDLTNERVLTGTPNRVTLTDDGAGAALTLTTPQDTHTGANLQVSSLGIGAAALGVAGSMLLSGTAPEVRFRETDQALPAGLWRQRLDINFLAVERNTAVAGDFSTFLQTLMIGSNEVILSALGAAAGSDSMTCAWQGFVVGPASRTIRAFNQTDAGIDGYRWIVSNDANARVMSLEVGPAGGSGPGTCIFDFVPGSATPSFTHQQGTLFLRPESAGDVLTAQIRGEDNPRAALRADQLRFGPGGAVGPLDIALARTGTSQLAIHRAIVDSAPVHIFTTTAGSVTVGNEQGIDLDFRWEGVSRPDMLRLDASTGNTGFGAAAPLERIHLLAADVGLETGIRAENTDNTNAASMAKLQARVGGAVAGDPFVQFTVAGIVDWSLGIDNSVGGDPLSFAKAAQLGTNEVFRLRDVLADTETAMLVLVDIAGVETMRQVTVGGIDSGGTGFRLMRVPNA